MKFFPITSFPTPSVSSTMGKCHDSYMHTTNPNCLLTTICGSI